MQNIVDEQQQQADAAMRSQTDQQGTPQATPPAARTPGGSTQQLPGAPHPSLLLSTPRANLLTATQQAPSSPSDADSPLKELRRFWEQQAQNRDTPPAVADTPGPAQQMQATQVSVSSESRY